VTGSKGALLGCEKECSIPQSRKIDDLQVFEIKLVTDATLESGTWVPNQIPLLSETCCS